MQQGLELDGIVGAMMGEGGGQPGAAGQADNAGFGGARWALGVAAGAGGWWRALALGRVPLRHSARRCSKRSKRWSVWEMRGQKKLRKGARSRAAMRAMAARRSVRMAQRVVVKLCIDVSYRR